MLHLIPTNDCVLFWYHIDEKSGSANDFGGKVDNETVQ
jgi:hypothetical protein